MTSFEEQEAARHVLWYVGDKRGWEPGSFTSKLLDAWARADRENDARLRGAFPALGIAVAYAQHEGADALAEWGGIS